MKKQDAIKIIGQRLSARTEEDMEEFIHGEMQLTQEGILEGGPFLPWFLSDVHVFSVGPDSAVQKLPDGFLMFDLEEGAYAPLDNGSKQMLEAVDSVDLRRLRLREGPPRFFALRGVDDIEFYPAVDQDYDVVFSFLKKDTPISEVSSEGENLWLRLAPNVLINEVGKVCAEILRDKDAYNLFGERADKAWQDLQTRHMERRLAGQVLSF